MVMTMIVTASFSTAMGQTERKYKEIHMETTSKVINVSADSLWNIIRQFDDVAIWSSSMDNITLHGEPEFEGASCSSRTCESAAGFGTVDEKMTLFSNASRELAYESSGEGPWFLVSGKNHWSVIEISPTQSALKLNFELQLEKFPGVFLAGFLRKSIAKGIPQFFQDLKVYAETGEVSKAKRERLMKIASKNRVVEKTLRSETINVSADSLWAILREFDKVADWASTLEHSEGTGEAKFDGATCNERVCEAPNNKFVEELTMFSDAKMELSYELTEGAPGFVRLAQNRWKVYSISPNQSVVEMNVTMHLSKFLGFFLQRAITKKMSKQVNIVLSDLKIYAETGQLSKAKVAQIEKGSRSNKDKQHSR